VLDVGTEIGRVGSKTNTYGSTWKPTRAARSLAAPRIRGLLGHPLPPRRLRMFRSQFGSVCSRRCCKMISTSTSEAIVAGPGEEHTRRPIILCSPQGKSPGRLAQPSQHQRPGVELSA
jgi:hypothetical protein